ncbi:L,D-transpeptidase family protein [Sulfurimonas sp.]
MLNKILLLLVLGLFAHANTILTNYRIHGIADIEKQMDKELANTAYWDEYLKNIDASFGYVEEYSSILTCDKEKSTLSLYKQNKDNKFTFVKQYNAFTGEKKGDKTKEGDLKTPLGVYKITKKISKLDSFYGPLAFVTSYPNVFDKYRGKEGHGIWIHGLPTEQERDEYTKGCIAINNSNIECLDRNIDIDSTVLIINSNEPKTEISKNTLSKLLAGLYKWRYSWLYNDIDTYLSFYSNDFVRTDGMKYERFVKYKTRIFNKGEKKKIIFSNINVISYPSSPNIFQITFKEYYSSTSFSFEGDKVLIVKIDENNNIKILTEK